MQSLEDINAELVQITLGVPHPLHLLYPSVSLAPDRLLKHRPLWRALLSQNARIAIRLRVTPPEACPNPWQTPHDLATEDAVFADSPTLVHKLYVCLYSWTTAVTTAVTANDAFPAPFVCWYAPS